MQDPFIGTWTLNVEKSQFDANHRPRAGTIALEVDQEGYYVQKAEGVNEKGENVAERPQRYIADGQYHPIQGFPELSSRATRVDANTMITEAKREDGSIVGGATKIVSADGKSITIDNFGYDSQLRQFKMRTVWDRQ
ncbi:MAG: hypothetical protein LAP38_14460 [Acidobacteriia bacterium]|nr:hypothetical protein [Terriglobia bacterium]